MVIGAKMEIEKMKFVEMNPFHFFIPDYRVLIVDDYPSFQQLLASSIGTLKRIEEVDFADNGLIAIEKAKIKLYDLIFLDVDMPEMDGYETCNLLRDIPAYKNTPIIMVSGNDSPFDEVKGIISGCTTYVTKPIQQEPFLKLCNRVFNWLEFQKNMISS
jgi:two-component system, cell cycle response regulator